MTDETNATELLSEDREPEPPRTRVVVSTTAEGAARLQRAFATGQLAHLGILAVEPAETADTEPPPPPSPPGPTIRDVRAVLASAANAALRLSKRPGIKAPMLSADSSREDLISWLRWNDPNHTDDGDAWEEEVTLDGAWEELARVDFQDVAGVSAPADPPPAEPPPAEPRWDDVAKVHDPVLAERATIAARCNAAAQGARYSGAPRLTADASRATLIAWLKWNDPNGEYDDPHVWREGPDGLMDEGWWVNAQGERPAWFGTGQEAEAKARAYAEDYTTPLEDLWAILAEVET
jgi:hypothetical protein